MKKQLRIGIIGCGFISAAHLAGYQKCPQVTIKALCDIVPERARMSRDKFGQADTSIYEDYREMIAREELDAVSVCTENNLHAGITIDCLNAGLHVFCEKPMAISGQEADRMVAAAKKNQKKLTVGYQSRFGDDARLLRNEVLQDRLGKIYYAEATILRRRGVPTWGVFLDKEKQGGGPLIDIGTHIVDATLWLMNDYSPVVSAVAATYDHLIEKGGYNQGGPWDIEAFEVEDSAFGTVTLASGAMLVVKATWAINIAAMNHSEVLLCGDKGGASLLNNKLTLNGERNGRLWQFVPESIADQTQNLYDREIMAWVEALVNDQDPVVLPEQAAQVVKVLEALYQSARSGKPYLA